MASSMNCACQCYMCEEGLGHCGIKPLCEEKRIQYASPGPVAADEVAASQQITGRNIGDCYFCDCKGVPGKVVADGRFMCDTDFLLALKDHELGTVSYCQKCRA